jgi:hypothetical protein
MDVASDKHVLWFAIESAHGKRTKQGLREFVESRMTRCNPVLSQGERPLLAQSGLWRND